MKGYLRQDGSGRWYLIPKEKVERFSGLLGALFLADWQERMKVVHSLTEEFEYYRLSGGVGDYEVEIKDE